MRSLLVLLFSLFALTAMGNPTYDKLVAVNSYWSQQKDIDHLSYPQYAERNDRAWIKLHLQLVEQVLRNRSTASLNKQQQQNRLNALGHLHQYWQAGNFPVNDLYTYKTPIFIDRHDNFCAVGYLVKATGHEDVSRMIAAHTNLAYVKDMHYPELFTWAKDYGFTVDELAWIQPTYGPCGKTYGVGNGTDSVVNELYTDTATQRLYVGGIFGKVDKTISANNIAYVTESGGAYTWHSMGAGVHGVVNAIASYHSKVFVAGAIDLAGGVAVGNVACWNDTAWSDAGCLKGNVRDLIVYKDSLYACGNFGVCPSNGPGSLAVWTGAGWRLIDGISGLANTMILKDSSLYIGGRCNYNGNMETVLKWHPQHGFQTFNNRLKNEVTDFEVFHDTLYASCKFTSFTDTVLFSRLVNGYWDTTIKWKFDANNTLSINTICAAGDTFICGGDFHYYPTVMGTDVENVWLMSDIYNPLPTHVFWKTGCITFGTDDAINCMAVFKNRIFFGGVFHYSYVTNSRSIGVMRIDHNSTATPLKITAPAITVGCSNNVGATVAASYAGGVPPYKFLWSTGDTTASVKNVKDGSYWYLVRDSIGAVDTASFAVNNTKLDVGVIQSGNTLTAHKASSTGFHWVDCDSNYRLIDSANMRSFTPARPGNYALILTSDGCIDTSNCYKISFTDVHEFTGSHVQVYPNPAGNEVNIAFGKLVAHATVNLTDVTGRVLNTQAVNNSSSVRLSTASLPPGIYTIAIKDEQNSTSYYKLTKQ